MVAKRKTNTRKQRKKSNKKSGPLKPRPSGKPRKAEARRLPIAEPAISETTLIRVGSVPERPSVTLENIRGETVIGDLLVAFPWTREALVKKGLRLEAEDAGDIYMSLEAFSAMNGVSVQTVVEDVVVVAREPPVKQAVPSLVAAPAT